MDDLDKRIRDNDDDFLEIDPYIVEKKERVRSRSVCEPSRIRPEILARIKTEGNTLRSHRGNKMGSDTETLQRTPSSDISFPEDKSGPCLTSFSTEDLVFDNPIASTVSLPSLTLRLQQESCEDIQIESTSSTKNERRPVKLKRRKAYYRGKREGRSKSLTHIDALDQAMQVRRDDSVDSSRSECDAPSISRLGVPSPSGPFIGGFPGSGSSVDAFSRRRRLSNAFKVHSSEFFSVSFECGEEPGSEEIVAAIKGTTLRDALASLCERRGLEIGNVSVFLDSSKTPLALNTTETFWLGGKHIRIKSKEKASHKDVKPTASHTLSSKKPSYSHRGSRKSSRAISNAASIEDPLDPGIFPYINPLLSSSPGGSYDGSLKSTRSLKQLNKWSGLFSSTSKETKMDVLVEQLNEYARNGIPKVFTDDLNETKFELEDDWRKIVDNWSSLTERLQQQQNAVWELVTTEATYIKTLRVISDLFLACLKSLHMCTILNEVESDQLFSNINEIADAHIDFWANYILPMVENARLHRSPLNPIAMQEGINKFDEIFHPYTRYCLEQSQCQTYCREKDQDNELFKAYLAWCETQRDCGRLRLTDLLVKPMQRLTKYPLLLKAILKKTDSDDQKIALADMIRHVENFVTHVNAAMRQQQEQERLSGIVARIESYDVVESKEEEIDRFLKQYSTLDLTRPMPNCAEYMRRNLIAEADLKLKDPNSSKIDVHIILFTDILLVCKALNKKAERMKVIRPPLFIDRLLMTEISRDPTAIGFVYLNELSVAVNAFTFHCPDQKQTKVWMDNIKKAQEQYADAKTMFEPYIADYEEDDYDYNSAQLIISRSPRGSSRGSRGSSLIHSHSGSMEQEGLPRLPSFEAAENQKFSSSSSEEVSSGLHDQSARRTTLSPRNSRKQLLTSRPSSNTLTVQVPHVTVVPSGQSLPNLLSFNVPIPQQTLSPHIRPAITNRGVSYPPPSPKGLVRTSPVPQSRNPPLVKTRHIGGSVTEDGHLVEAVNPDVAVSCKATVLRLPPSGVETLPGDLIEEVGLSEEDLSLAKSMPGASAFAKRLIRNGEGRRYHTASAVEDLKRQDCKDASIQKRFSLNYGQHIGSNQQTTLTPSSSGLADSMISFSSSGVSSSASLHFSVNSEGEDCFDSISNLSQGCQKPNEGTNWNCKYGKLLSPSFASRPFSNPPQFSSTPSPSPKNLEQPSKSQDTINQPESQYRLEVAEISEGISSVQITVSGTDQKAKDDLLRLKDLILSDCSVEASEV
ncbi:hypothetical protein QYM36_002459 [Artemia franciscana]|uniref:Pleckstrin homology domain-containing family G member 5 n=4 Tax=Artemia franciscana TaxID=6661 RepID=A0AA88IHH2_ARTSF|nr:hypothetical protein QYM36_002459 [Artemia franciscana]